MENEQKEFKVIKCPHCGYEYLPQEIYHPIYFFGSAKEIIRDEHGHIINIEGTTLDLCEEFECYNCDTAFNISANIDFKTEINHEHTFSEDFSSEIHENRVELSED